MSRSSSRLRRAASVDRLSSSPSRIDSCDLVGFPYCCTKHYYGYRRWPYYMDPADFPQQHHRYYNHRYWPDWPYSSYYDYYYHRSRPSWYYYEDDYYGDYLRGYAEGMRKYDDQQQHRKQRASVGDLTKLSSAAAATTPPAYLDKYHYPTSCWWYYRPYYYRSRYLL